MVNQSYNKSYSLGSDINLISCFITAIQSFSRELTGSNMKTIAFENFIVHFYKNSNYPSLLFVIVTDLNFNPNEINCKICKIVSAFLNQYKSSINNFNGEVSVFKPFEKRLIEMKIAEKNCGSPNECINCPFSTEKSQIIHIIKKNEKIVVSLLDKLFQSLLDEINDLLAVLVIDFDGFIISQQYVKGFDDSIIDSIINVVEPSIKKIKKFSETSYGSGTFDTNEFRLFYLELGGSIPVLFILCANPTSNIDEIIPYSYIIAEKVSRILNNQNTNLQIPTFLEGGNIEFTSKEDLVAGRNLINNIIIIGPEMAGKTSLVEMYVNGKFEKEYKPTIGLSILKKNLQITKRSNITLNILDMGSLKSFAKIRKYFYKVSNIKAIIILFDYTRIDTLDNVKEWIKEVRTFIKENEITYILVGNKADLVENRDEIKKKALKIANQYNLNFFTTSALTGEGLDELFMYLLNFASNLS
ncbi:MAG: Rab family GTPase [Promethearchaeota archaeon]